MKQFVFVFEVCWNLKCLLIGRCIVLTTFNYLINSSDSHFLTCHFVFFLMLTRLNVGCLVRD